MSIYSMYFSPTGGTKKVMDILAEGLSVERQIDLLAADVDYGSYSFKEEDVCLIGVPSFGGRVPSVALERMRQMQANGAMAVIVVVFGNRAYDDTLLELKNEAVSGGYQVGAAIAAVAEHSVMHQFAKGRPDTQDEADLRQFSKEIAELIADRGKVKDFSVPGNPEYRKYNGIPIKPQAGRACTKCGLCAEQCPVGAIPFSNPASVDKKKCITCMRCVTVCPLNARKLNKLILSVVGLAAKKAFTPRKANELYL